jgi:hypothetical protein
MEPLNYKAFHMSASLLQRLKVGAGWRIVGSFMLGSGMMFVGLMSTISFGHIPPWLFVLLFFGGAVIVVGVLEYRKSGTIVRLREFARVNNLSYRDNVPYEDRPGLIFHEGHTKVFVDLITASNRDFSEIGNYQYETGGGKSRTTHVVGFMRIHLPRRLPNMVLDAKQNNFFGKFSNLPTRFARNQKLELEGDFSKYFTLYAPAEYAVDALYVFTPDVMQALIESAHTYDCEVIDDNFYVYKSGKFDLTDETIFEELRAVAARLRTELTAQTDYYADGRVGNRLVNVVDVRGARLRTKLTIPSILTIIAAIVYLLYAVLPLIL